MIKLFTHKKKIMIKFGNAVLILLLILYFGALAVNCVAIIGGCI